MLFKEIYSDLNKLISELNHDETKTTGEKLDLINKKIITSGRVLDIKKIMLHIKPQQGKEMDKNAYFYMIEPTEGERRNDLLSILYNAFDNYDKHKDREQLTQEVNEILEREHF